MDPGLQSTSYRIIQLDMNSATPAEGMIDVMAGFLMTMGMTNVSKAKKHVIPNFLKICLEYALWRTMMR